MWYFVCVFSVLAHEIAAIAGKISNLRFRSAVSMSHSSHRKTGTDSIANLLRELEERKQHIHAKLKESLRLQSVFAAEASNVRQKAKIECDTLVREFTAKAEEKAAKFTELARSHAKVASDIQKSLESLGLATAGQHEGLSTPAADLETRRPATPISIFSDNEASESAAPPCEPERASVSGSSVAALVGENGYDMQSYALPATSGTDEDDVEQYVRSTKRRKVRSWGTGGTSVHQAIVAALKANESRFEGMNAARIRECLIDEHNMRAVDVDTVRRALGSGVDTFKYVLRGKRDKAVYTRQQLATATLAPSEEAKMDEEKQEETTS